MDEPEDDITQYGQEELSQKNRVLPALFPSYIPVDEHGLKEALYYASWYSNLVRYYNLQNIPQGDWQPFFRNQQIFILAVAASYDLQQMEQDYEDEANATLKETDYTKKFDRFEALFQTQVDMAHLIDYAHTQLELVYYVDGEEFDAQIKVDTDQVNALRDLKSYALGAAEPQALDQPIDVSFDNFSNAWPLEDVEPDASIYEGYTKAKRIDAAVPKLTEPFNAFLKKLTDIRNVCNRFLVSTLEAERNNNPNTALFLSFATLLGSEKQLINTITKRHLEFYYNDVLKQQHREEVPDEVYVYFTLDENFPFYKVAQDTELLAGYDEDGNSIVFTTQQPLTVTASTISSFMTVYVSTNPNVYTGNHFVWPGVLDFGKPFVNAIYSNPEPNLIDEETDGNRVAWPLFGRDQYNRSGYQRDMMEATIGFMIGSPTLYLLEGTRTVTLTLSFQQEGFDDMLTQIESIATDNKAIPGISFDYAFHKIFSTGWLLDITTAEGWMRIPHFGIGLNTSACALEVQFTLSDTDPAIVGYDPEVYTEGYTTTNPLVKMVLNNHGWVYPYSLLKELVLANIEVGVVVEGVRNLVVYNAEGQVSIDEPFPAFGGNPEVGSQLLVGNSEVFEKPLTDLRFHLKWSNLPLDQMGFTGYFAGYKVLIKNSDYKVGLSRLSNRKWYPIPAESQQFELFETVPSAHPKTHQELEKETTIDQVNMRDIQVPATYQFTDELVYDTNTQSGFVSLELMEPDFAFGQNAYAERLSEVLLINANNTLKNRDNEKIVIVPEPNPPFIPMLSEISLSYASSSQLFSGVNEPADTHEPDEFFQLSPFGFQKMDTTAAELNVQLVPQFMDMGYLYMGIEHLNTAFDQAFYFQLSDGVAKHSQLVEREISWAYLDGNDWVDFPDNSILTDGTQGFIKSGIITVNMQFTPSLQHTVCPSGLSWIRIAVTHTQRSSLVRAFGVNLQGVVAEWSKNNDSPMRLVEPLPAYSITTTVDQIEAIAGVTQPFASFMGLLPETEQEYWVRVSERLRHKNRAVAPWDSEALVLQHFPVVQKVRCFSANEIKDCYTGYKAGMVLVAVLPDVNNTLVKNKLSPKLTLSVLDAIRNMLQARASTFVNVVVQNPVYEWMRVICTVTFTAGVDSGEMVKQLNHSLVEYLTPWLGDGSKNQFGASVYRADVLGFVKSQDYVEGVTGFSMEKVATVDGLYVLEDTTADSLDPDDSGVNSLTPEYPWAMLISAEFHTIHVSTSNVRKEPKPRAIGNMQIGSDFIVVQEELPEFLPGDGTNTNTGKDEN